MTKFASAGLAAVTLAALAAPSAASAAVTISGAVTALGLPADPGLALTGSAIAFSNFTLANVGDTFTTNVLRIGTNETSVDFDDFATSPVSATFTFSSPLGAGGTASGSSQGFYRLFSSCGLLAGGCGRVQWTNPTIFTFGNGGAFSVRLSNVEFGTPGSANVAARFELLANSVPEPATWGLLILGFGVIGGALRSQRKTRAGLTYA